MNKSENMDVQRFIDDLRLMDEDKYVLLNLIRDIIFEVYPNVDEKIMYGGIMFSLDEDDFSGLFVRKNHLSLEFASGFLMKDTHNSLEGGGKYRRHLKIRTKEDIENKEVRFFVNQAYK